MKTRTIATTMLTVAILTISAGMAQARVIVRPRVVVVKPKVVVVKPAPVKKAKVWIPGHFVKRPHHRKVWVPGHWKKV
ncbi:MAG: BcpO-related WXXGXW repeat protein [bacterium]|nr:BcpO-related WXXGXW repeat protein [bacterium]MCP4798972.1 BcpO-related WXXGXW repeat protein [bacterium]